MELLRPNTERAKKAILFVWIAMAVDIVSFGSGCMQYSLLTDAANGLGVTQEQASSNDLREQILAWVQVLVLIVSGVYFIMWFRRAYFNLSQLTTMTYGDGWAAGCWFVPILSLYRPFQMMKELYNETVMVLVKQNKPADLTTSNLGWWWALYLINSLAGQISFRVARAAETIPELQRLTLFNMALHILGIPLAIITVKVIRDYAVVESLLGGESSAFAEMDKGDKALDQDVF